MSGQPYLTHYGVVVCGQPCLTHYGVRVGVGVGVGERLSEAYANDGRARVVRSLNKLRCLRCEMVVTQLSDAFMMVGHTHTHRYQSTDGTPNPDSNTHTSRTHTQVSVDRRDS